MDLSVIIVNYNVKYFAEQCIRSVQKAMQGMAVEIIVVDNDSTDGSVEYLSNLFPDVNFICNTTNKGFGAANNQGAVVAKGRHLLFLNPDTVVAEDSLQQLLWRLQRGAATGAVGLRMIDGAGRYLPESKRGLPTPWAAFCKMCGLSALFPFSRLFGQYYLGHLCPDRDHEVAVLAGACMAMRREVWDKMGGFDEQFFMYGEDVDLSYRIRQAGYKNYYLAGTTILHFKGESTRRGSWQYVKHFYEAMHIFTKKHFGASYGGLYVGCLQLAIGVFRVAALLRRLLVRIGLPMLDFFSMMALLLVVKHFWLQDVKAGDTYLLLLLSTSFPLYVLFWWGGLQVSGAYEQIPPRRSVVNGVVMGTLGILAFYNLLPATYRFAYALLLGAALVNVFVLSAWRTLLQGFRMHGFRGVAKMPCRMLLMGTGSAVHRARSILQQSVPAVELVVLQAPVQKGVDAKKLQALLQSYRVQGIVYCEEGWSYKGILTCMQQLGDRYAHRILSQGSGVIIGSDLARQQGQVFGPLLVSYRLHQPFYRRLKRISDLVLALLLLLLSPFHGWRTKRPVALICQSWKVLQGRCSWIGYASSSPAGNWPVLLPGIYSTSSFVDPSGGEASVRQADEQYAMYYHPWMDWLLVWEGLVKKEQGRQFFNL